MYSVELTRNTKETQIKAWLTVGGDCVLDGSTGIGFFDHMLNSFCIHGNFSLKMTVKGDLNVDCHHTVEDVGIVLGKLLSELREQIGSVERFGHAFIPMDEALASAAVDAGGRAYLVCDVPVTAPMIGDYDTQTTTEFFRALAYNAAITLHVKVLYGNNDHHKVEAAFKAVAHALKQAYTKRETGLLSAKGVLE